MNFGTNLRMLMKENSLTQSALAKHIGYTQRAISKWVNHQAEPTESAIVKVAAHFHVSTGFLLGTEDDFGTVLCPTISKEEQQLLLDYRNMRPDLKTVFLELAETWGGQTKTPPYAEANRGGQNRTPSYAEANAGAAGRAQRNLERISHSPRRTDESM